MSQQYRKGRRRCQPPDGIWAPSRLDVDRELLDSPGRLSPF
jgi:hypothetical protein